MSIYVIGDVQGCYDALMYLLEQIDFDASRDKLWFAGDLVNRGHDSLGVLRFVKGLKNRAVTVLGNHDLHLLAISQKNPTHRSKDGSLDALLQAPDLHELVDWLRQQPLIHHSKKYDVTLVHAGLPPQWDVRTGLKRAAEVEAVLRGDRFHAFMHHLYGDQPDQWRDDLTGWDRLRTIVNCLTRIRYCDINGRMEMQEKLAPTETDTIYKPWYAIAGRVSSGERILFGHWSTLGYQVVNKTYSLDTGCVWDGELSALKIRRDGSTRLYQVSCHDHGRGVRKLRH